MEFLIGIVVLLGLITLVVVASGVRIVQPYQKGVVERLGKYKETVDPGLRIIVPFVDRLRAVDMREQVIDVPPQEVITQDNVTAAVDAVVYFEPTDPQRLLYNISNFQLAVTKLAQTNLRNVIGEMTLDEAFTSRERVNSALRQILDDATDKWGVRVVRVEIQRIDPPADVMHAMHEQMKAERTRRAVVTEAEGSREAAVTRAEGEKAAAILSAEGRRQKDILNAQGEAEATRLRAEAEQYRQSVVAEGEADAIDRVYRAIQDAGTDDRVIAVKYLETMAQMANGRATKIFLPADMSSAMGAIGGISEMVREAASEPKPPASARREPRPLPDPPKIDDMATIEHEARAAVEAAKAEIESSAPPPPRMTPPAPGA
ncbi:MAG: SPFH/Band 7/PHB domain protein [Acidimicrobiales bacterium]|nr:SPFH/Band 7/PHB domain protein [Acidimicrobiales bacterium]